MPIFSVINTAAAQDTFYQGMVKDAANWAVLEAALSAATTHILVGGGAGTAPVFTQATGSGAPVRATSPTLVTPTLGVATATSINKVALTAPATGSTVTVADGKTLTASASITLAGTDGKTLTTSASLTLAGTDGRTLTVTGDTTLNGVASETNSGPVEIATAAETTTGADATRAVSPDGLAGSVYGKRVVQIKIIDDATALTTGDGKIIFCIPPELNSYNLVDADAFVTTPSSSGAPTVMIRNVTDTADMLSVAITVDANEYTSYTAATAPTINGATDDVATGDLIAVDCDGAGTGAKGLGVILTFQLP